MDTVDTTIAQPPLDGVAVRMAVHDAVHEARERWGERVDLPVDLPAALWPPGGLPVGLAALLLGLSHGGMAAWLAPRDAPPCVLEWLHLHTAARWQDRPQPCEVAMAGLRAASAEPSLWWRLGDAVLVIEVPALVERPGPMRREPGDVELTPRLVVQYPGREAAKVLAVGGLSRQFWRERAAVQRCGGFGADLLLVDGLSCCCVPAAALVSVQA